MAKLRTHAPENKILAHPSEAAPPWALGLGWAAEPATAKGAALAAHETNGEARARFLRRLRHRG
jgi:hypothetical protein